MSNEFRIVPSRTGEDIRDVLSGMSRIGYMTDDAVYMLNRHGYAELIAKYDTMTEARECIAAWLAENTTCAPEIVDTTTHGSSRRISERRWLSLKNILGR